MSPRTDGYVRPFGRKQKKVKVEGHEFMASYTMDKVLVHEKRLTKKTPNLAQRLEADRGVTAEELEKLRKENPYGRYWSAGAVPAVHGPYQAMFDYTPYLPKKRKDGRWTPGKWLPFIPKSKLVMCAYGYHATTFKFTRGWGKDNPGHHVYLVECVGPLTAAPRGQKLLEGRVHYGTDVGASKYAFSSIRLLRLIG